MGASAAPARTARRLRHSVSDVLGPDEQAPLDGPAAAGGAHTCLACKDLVAADHGQARCADEVDDEVRAGRDDVEALDERRVGADLASHIDVAQLRAARARLSQSRARCASIAL